MSKPGTILRYGGDEIELLHRMSQVMALVHAGRVRFERPAALAFTFPLTGTDAERRVKADAIAASMGATARSEGGFFRASVPGTETLDIELEFVPPIPAEPGEGMAPDGIDC